MITTLKGPISEWHTLPAFFATPSDYETNPTKLYPTILFFHGKGEAGTDINKVLGSYLPKRAKAGDISAISPITGETEKFIVIGVQDGYWCPWPTYYKKVVDHILTTYKLRVDPNRVYTTGLSAGGQCALMYGAWDDTFIGKVAAINSLSPAVLEKQAIDNLPKVGKAQTPVWFWSGTTDQHFTENATRYRDSINSTANPDCATLTTFVGGHCCWDSVYAGNIKTKSLDGTKDLNLYEWFLQFDLGLPLPEPEDPCKDCPCPEPEPCPECPPIPEQVKPLYIMMSDGTKLNVQ